MELISLKSFVETYYDIELDEEAKDIIIQMPINCNIPAQLKERKLLLPWEVFKDMLFKLNSNQTLNHSIIFSKLPKISEFNCWKDIYNICGQNVINFLFFQCELFYKVKKTYVGIKCSEMSQSNYAKQKKQLLFVKHTVERDFDLGQFGNSTISMNKLYNYSRCWKWPKRSALSKKYSSNDSFINEIFENTFSIKIFNQDKYMSNVLKGLNILLRRHGCSSLPFAKMYGKYFFGKEIGPLNKKRVLMCIKHMILKYLPKYLFVSRREQVKFAHWVKKVLSLCGYQGVTVNEMVQNVLMLEDNNNVVLLRARLLKWLLEDYVFSMAQMFFHFNLGITNEVCVYSARYWRNKRKRLFKSLRKNKLTPPTNESTGESFDNNVFLSVRFLPKKDPAKFRPLIYNRNCTEESVIKHSNTLLRQIISKNQGNLTGNTTCDVYDLWTKLYSRMAIKKNKLYYVKVDIKDAYGSILHDVLLRILDTEMKVQEEKLEVACYYYKDQVFQKNYFQFTSLPLTLPSGFATEDCKLRKFISKTVLHNYIVSKIINLKVRLTNSKSFYFLKKGIPQGGKLSSALCALYYSTFDSECLSDFINDNDFFYRAVDDYLYVTDSYDKAIRFKQLMTAGFEKYGVYIEQNKTVSNLDAKDINSVPYFGYLFDTNKMYVQVYYAIYENRKKIFNGVSFKSKHKWLLLNQMKNTVSIKIHPVLFSTYYNSKRIIYENIMNACTVLCLRYKAIARELLLNPFNDEAYLTYCAIVAANTIAKQTLKTSDQHQEFACTSSQRPRFSYINAKYIVFKTFIKILNQDDLYEKVVGNLRRLSGRLEHRIRVRDKKLSLKVIQSLPQVLKDCY